jgi:hypothetical protein
MCPVETIQLNHFQGGAMDEGRIRGTDQMWPAEQIWQLGDATAVSWCCVGCEAPLTPSAWRPENNHKRTAHFEARNGHQPGCTVEGLEKLMGTSKRKTIKTKDDLPGPYPSAVRFVDRHQRIAGEGEAVEGERDVYRPARDGGEDRPKNPSHKRTVTTIRQICRFYHAFPQLRGLALDIPGCDGGTYFDIFHPLSNDYDGIIERRILYAGIRFKDAPDYAREYLRIALNLSNSLVVKDEVTRRPVYLLIDWHGWSPTQKGLFRNHFEDVRDNLGKKYKAARDAKSKNLPSATIFFVGSRISEDEFLTDDHRKICLIGA